MTEKEWVWGDGGKITECEECGQIHPCEFRADPYDAEIDGNWDEIWICELCYKASDDDI